MHEHQPDGRDPPQPLVARFDLESFAYMSFHPCECGNEAISDVKIDIRAPHAFAVYDAPCTSCGRRRFFEFRLDSDFDAPSAIVDAGQWLLTAARYASVVPADLESLHGERREATASYLARAVTALEEALKFVGNDEDRVPATALFSAEGRALYANEPGRFRRVRIAAVLDTYRASLAELRRR